MNRYRAYGLEIDSEIVLPELLPGSGGSADVRIRYGEVPETLSNARAGAGYYRAAPGSLLLGGGRAARYLVCGGREIVVERLDECIDEVLRLYLLGSALGGLLHQRRLLVMHASTIYTSRGAVLFVGETGHGKSTLVAALVQRGYAMLADDVTAVSMKDPDQSLALSSFPSLRLCADAVERLNYWSAAIARVQSPGRADQKYVVGIENFQTEPLPVHAIYALNVHEGLDIRVEAVTSMERFAVVVGNTYRVNFLKGLGLQKQHFDFAARLAKTVDFTRITRPKTPYLLDELVDRLEIALGKPPGIEAKRQAL